MKIISLILLSFLDISHSLCFLLHIIWILFEPTMENTFDRLILQMTFVDLFLIRLLWKCHISRNFPQKIKCSSIVAPQNILILTETILDVLNIDSTGKKDVKFSGIIFGYV